MGRGNWRPYRDSEIYDLRYFDLYEYLGEAEIWDHDWDMFIEIIGDRLPDSFYRVESTIGGVPYTNYPRDNRVIYANDLVCIMIDASASADHVGVAMVLLEDEFNYSDPPYRGNFGPKYLATQAPKLWEAMGGSPLIYTSPWTTAPAA